MWLRDRLCVREGASFYIIFQMLWWLLAQPGEGCPLQALAGGTPETFGSLTKVLRCTLISSPFLLLPFLFPTCPLSLHPFIRNALLISYHVLGITTGIDAMKKKI